MTYLGEFATAATVNAYFLTVSSSGEPSASTSVAIQIYRDATTERSTAGITLTAAHGGTTGAHMLQVAMTSTFYTTGDYFARISAGTVDSRQLTGYPVACWSIKNTNRYQNVGMWSNSTVLSPTVAGVPEVDVTHIQGTSSGSTATWIAARADVTQWLGSAAATPTVAGVPEVDVTHWTGSTVGALSSGAVPANITQILGSTADFSSGALPANVEQVNGSTVGSTATIIGISTGATITSVQSVSSTVAANVVQWGGSTVGALSSGAVSANLQQINGSTAGFSSGAVPANVQQVNGSTAGSTATIIGTSTGATITSVGSVSSTVSANVVQWGGSTVGALSSGAVPSNLQQIQGSTADFSSGALPANVEQVNGSTAGSTATIIGISTGATIASVASISGTGSTGVVFGARLTATGVDDIWDEIVDGTSMTARQSWRLANSANAGLTSGAGTAAFNVRDIDNTQNRIAATVSTGNRTAVTLSVSS